MRTYARGSCSLSMLRIYPIVAVACRYYSTMVISAGGRRSRSRLYPLGVIAGLAGLPYGTSVVSDPPATSISQVSVHGSYPSRRASSCSRSTVPTCARHSAGGR